MKTLFSLQLNRIDKIFLLIMGVLLIIGVFTLILMIANRGHGKVILKRHIKKYEYNVRFYSFDYSANLISYFDRKDIKRKITQSIDYFTSNFQAMTLKTLKIGWQTTSMILIKLANILKLRFIYVETKKSLLHYSNLLL